MINTLFKETLLPRMVFVPHLIAKCILFVTTIAFWLTGARRLNGTISTLCIEAGVRGWESIEFKELYQSGCEFLSTDNVCRLVIQPGIDYLEQVAGALSQGQITHYLYDPRTGSQELWLGLWQSLRVAMLLQKYNVVPIVLLTDLSMRNWRAQSAIVTARKGVVVCFISSRCVAPIFPHRRLLGPSLMPFSVKTKQMLDDLIKQRPQNRPAKAIFAGSLYEPRITVLEKIRSGLAARGVMFEVKGREAGGPRVSDHEYWSRLCYSDIVVTTACQIDHAGGDWTHIQQLVYRYLEVLASGTLLVAPDVPGVRRFFSPGEHFVSFDSPEEAIDIIFNFLGNETERLKIARSGKERADALISSRCFWISIDLALGADSMH